MRDRVRRSASGLSRVRPAHPGSACVLRGRRMDRDRTESLPGMGHAGVGRLVAARDESMTGSRRGWLLFPGWTQAGFLKHATAAVARPFGLAGDFRSLAGRGQPPVDRDDPCVPGGKVERPRPPGLPGSAPSRVAHPEFPLLLVNDSGRPLAGRPWRASNVRRSCRPSGLRAPGEATPEWSEASPDWPPCGGEGAWIGVSRCCPG